jgi:PPOX class probable F420-dependent enzyme
MTDFPSTHTDLLDLPVATLATISADGSPQLTEVWFLHEDGELKLSLNKTRHKTKNLTARPQCALFLLDLENPYRYMNVRGRARIEPDDDYTFADRLGQKYGGADLRNNDNPGETRVVVTIEPSSIYPVDMNA